MPREIVDHIKNDIKENLDRITEDIGHVVEGHPENISPETKTKLKEMAIQALVDSGARELDIQIDDHTSIGVRRDRDGTFRVGFRVEF